MARCIVCLRVAILSNEKSGYVCREYDQFGFVGFGQLMTTVVFSQGYTSLNLNYFVCSIYQAWTNWEV